MLIKSQKVYLKDLRSKHGPNTKAWEVKKVINRLNPRPGDYLSEGEVKALIQDRQTTVEIT